MVSVSFKYVHSHKFKQIQLVKPYTAYVNSVVTWVRDESSQVFVFTMKDTEVYDLQSGEISALEHNEVKFMVNLQGIFVSLSLR
jgi:hypothetical protein